MKKLLAIATIFVLLCATVTVFADDVGGGGTPNQELINEEALDAAEESEEVQEEEPVEEEIIEELDDETPEEEPVPEGEMYTNVLRKGSTLQVIRAQAIGDGKNSSFTVDNSKNSTAGYVIFKVDDYKGSCIQKGVSYSLSGTAKMTLLSNSSNLAKVAYYVDIKKGWYNNSTDRPAIMDSSGVGSRFKIGLMAEDMLQCANQGADTWKAKALAQTYPEAYADYVCNLVNEIANGSAAPSGFKIYKGSPSDNSQDFAVWKFEPTVPITISKTTVGTITANNSLYSVSGTTFKLYDSQANAKADKSAVATFSIGSNGKSSSVEVEKGTYYLVETKAGNGLVIPDVLKAASGGKQIKIEGTATINI